VTGDGPQGIGHSGVGVSAIGSRLRDPGSWSPRGRRLNSWLPRPSPVTWN